MTTLEAMMSVVVHSVVSTPVDPHGLAWMRRSDSPA